MDQNSPTLIARRMRWFRYLLAVSAMVLAGAVGAAMAEPPPQGAPQSLTLTPGSIIIMPGEPQTFRLFDDQKRPVRDASWMLSDPALAEIKINGNTATVNGLSRGKTVLTATWKGLSVQARITVLGDSALASGGSQKNSEWFRVTPNIANILVGETQPFRLVDENGKQIRDADWSVNNTSVGELTPGSDATLETRATGKVTVTAESQGHRAQAEVTVLAGTTLPVGSVKWSVKELPGFATMEIKPAVPSPSGLDVFATEQDACGRQVVRALTADGLEVWRRQMTAGRNPAAENKSPFTLAEGTCPNPPPASGSTRH